VNEKIAGTTLSVVSIRPVAVFDSIPSV